MAQKAKEQSPRKKSFLYNLGLIVLICAVMYWAFFTLLDVFTRHGKSVQIPEVVGMLLPDAVKIAEDRGLEIDVDSAYFANRKPLEIISQRPDSGFNVKKGHTMVVTVNKIIPPSIPMPKLVNLSYRSALMLLETSKLKLGDTIMRPDLAQGAVLEQLFNGKEIAVGTPIPQGSAITLVIGTHMGNFEIEVPNVEGLSYSEAIALLSGNNLNYNIFYEGNITDTTSAVVFKQDPKPFDPQTLEVNTIEEGNVINLFVHQ